MKNVAQSLFRYWQNNNMKNVLITGASGTVGYEALQQLLASNKYNITVFDKKTPNAEKKYKSLSNRSFDLVYGDLNNDSDLKKVSKDQDVVIHLGAIIPPLADEKPDLAYAVNTLGTRKLIRNLEKHSPNAFFLYSSSISVYGDRINNPDIKVGDPLLPSEGDEYAITKIESEKIIQSSSLQWSIFRLAAIMGNHKVSKLMFHMPLETPVEICTPEDTARAFVKAIEKQEELNGKIFNLGGGENCRLTYRELLEESFQIMGLGKLDFPEKSFAEKNFHCGYYADGDQLENILHFRRDDLKAYFSKVENSVPAVQKVATSIFKKVIKKRLLRVSEPYHSYKNQDTQMMQRFFV